MSASADQAIRVAAIQLDVGIDESRAERLERASALVHAEAEAGADIVLLPEMWLRGWLDFGRYEETAEPEDGPTATAMADLAGETGVLLVAGSIVERDGDDLYNTALVYDRDGSRVAKYRKIHLFGYEDALEAELLSAGDAVVTFEWHGARIGVSICYDLRFPELYRCQVEAGAELMLVVSSWPYPRVEAWRTFVRARATENQAALVACNACGHQAGRQYGGHSAAYDAWGERLGELGDEQDVLLATIDIDHVRQARRDFPALRDRVLGVAPSLLG